MSSSDESIWGPLIQRAHTGDRSAVDDMLARANSRLESLARKMLKDYPVVKRWDQTGDVLQAALLRLERALRKAPPANLRHFLRLAALQIRRTLIELARKHQGPEGLAAHHESAFTSGDQQASDAERFVDSTEPETLEEWAEFHLAIDRLPEEEGEVFQLLWYHELTYPECAQILGVCEKTVQRRWLAAKLSLGRMLETNR